MSQHQDRGCLPWILYLNWFQTEIRLEILFLLHKIPAHQQPAFLPNTWPRDSILTFRSSLSSPISESCSCSTRLLPSSNQFSFPIPDLGTPSSHEVSQNSLRLWDDYKYEVSQVGFVPLPVNQKVLVRRSVGIHQFLFLKC
eukprot:GFUD01137892.1.p1 GENE.GFUD01137892.1~~GFUD01137892.1.p1  ORF type:complete len:141 (-),score=17.38 GFUD01137892.1:1004-1426(-)